MDLSSLYKKCTLCPRECGVDRSVRKGFCQCGTTIKAARAALHMWEEPCISGTKGSGAVFFSGCTLKCCFCQNYKISSEGYGKEISDSHLAEIFLDLQKQGAHNINLVTPTQYLPSIIHALDLVRGKLSIPVVYNCGGYEKEETIQLLKDYVDIFLPDLKYFDPALGQELSYAENYFPTAIKAVKKMIEITGKPEFAPNGLLKKGVIIRHMVLPGCYKDSIALLHAMKSYLEDDTYLLSILSQYTPAFHSGDHPKINRRLTTYEYEKVVDEAVRLGLTHGYMQERTSAKEEYTPPFTLEGL